MRRMGWAILLMTGLAAEAAEPVPAPAAAVASPDAAVVPAAPGSKSAPRPLNLRIGDIRRYITPEEYRELMAAPAQDANTIIVQADAPLLPMKSEAPVPGGLMSLWYAAKNPAQIWRIFVPDPKQGPIGPPESPIPPPVFRWGP